MEFANSIYSVPGRVPTIGGGWCPAELGILPPEPLLFMLSRESLLSHPLHPILPFRGTFSPLVSPVSSDQQYSQTPATKYKIVAASMAAFLLPRKTGTLATHTTERPDVAVHLGSGLWWKMGEEPPITERKHGSLKIP